VQIPLTKCPLCGLPSEEPVCSRCNTVIEWEKATCPICGRMFSSSMAVCDICDKALLPPKELADEDKELRHLMMIAGVSKDAARTLYMQGIRNFSDLVKLALPHQAKRMGLHKTIARRMMMAEFVRRGQKADDGNCPICSGPYNPETGFCEKCKYSPLPEWSEHWMKERLDKLTDEVENLCSHPDFQAMPEDMKKQVLSEVNGMLEPVFNEERLVAELESVFGSIDEEEENVKQYRMQIDAWRKKGFDVSALEGLLDKSVDDFRANCVKILRLQMHKKHKEFKFLCPLCEAGLAAEAKECPNCGAKFEQTQA
jgi:predicted amidophosphoribosyltransferase